MKAYKYPRTYHLPWSCGLQSDDKLAENLDFLNGEIVVTEKLDGSNFSLYSNNIHARSIDGRNHESFHWIKQYHAAIKHLIPEGFRICGEYLFAQHSIPYEDLESYFYAFSVWDGDYCLSWDDTQSFIEERGLILARVLYRGTWKGSWENFHKEIWNVDESTHEGYVIRSASSFKYQDFSNNIAKYVRKNHVQTDQHWAHKQITKNKIRNRLNSHSTMRNL